MRDRPLVGSGSSSSWRSSAPARNGSAFTRLTRNGSARGSAEVTAIHAVIGFVDRIARQRRAPRPQLGELLGLELAEAEEVRDLGVAIDRDDRQRLRQAAARQAREQAHERELIEQVVLEPQDELLGAGGLVDALVVVRELLRASAAFPRVAQNSPRPLVVLGVADREQRALVERVGPHADLAGQIGERERVGGAVAVADMDDAFHAALVSLIARGCLGIEPADDFGGLILRPRGPSWALSTGSPPGTARSPVQIRARDDRLVRELDGSPTLWQTVQWVASSGATSWSKISRGVFSGGVVPLGSSNCSG